MVTRNFCAPSANLSFSYVNSTIAIQLSMEGGVPDC